MHKIRVIQLLVFMALFRGSGAMASDPEKYIAESLPQQWTYASEFSQTLPSDDRWWQTFGDPLLDSLITEGVNSNYNVLMAARRIEIARQTLRQTRAQYMPTIGMQGGWTKTRTSGMNAVTPGVQTTMDYFSLGLDMNWEIDVFGKIASRAKGDKASLNATRAEYDGAMVAMCANIATAYMQLRTLQAEAEVTKAHIASQAKVVKITEARHEAGLASMLDVSQAKTVYYSTMAGLTSIDTSIRTTINSIAVLLGVYPEQLASRLLAPAPMPEYHQIVGAGIPLDLLRRRPDVVEAEQTLASYAAAVGVAKKDFLPSIALSGSVGTSGHAIKELFKDGSFTYTIAPTLSWTLFDGLARNAALSSAKQQMQIGIDNYNLTIVTAVQEVDNAMVSYLNALDYIAYIESVVEQAQKSYDLSIDLYKRGLDSFINVSNSQITLLQYANELMVARGQALSALISLYEALGGGWTDKMK